MGWALLIAILLLSGEEEAHAREWRDTPQSSFPEQKTTPDTFYFTLLLENSSGRPAGTYKGLIQPGIDQPVTVARPAPGAGFLQTFVSDKDGDEASQNIHLNINLTVPAPWYAGWWVYALGVILLGTNLFLLFIWWPARKGIHRPGESGKRNKNTGGAAESSGAEQPDPENEAFANRARSLIEQDFTVHWKVTELARAMTASPSQLHKKLKAATRMYPTAFIRHIRLAKARQLMQEHPGWPSARIAAEVGFNSPSEFSRRFKDAFGATPSAWRATGQSGN